MLNEYLNSLNQTDMNLEFKDDITTDLDKTIILDDEEDDDIQFYKPSNIDLFTGEFSVNSQQYLCMITDLSGNNIEQRFKKMRVYYYLKDKVILFISKSNHK